MTNIMPHNNLSQLRNNPRQTAKNNIFYVNTINMAVAQVGGSVRITPEIKNGITVLNISSNISPNGTDYYFPYIRGAGEVTVVPPPNNNLEGTIVVTGGMNGCALEATVRNNQFVFYHDQNGSAMARVRNAGRTVCSITANSYWPEGMQFQSHQYPIVQFVCIYRNSFWHVVCFGLLTNGGHNVNGGFEPKGGRYRGYFNDNIRACPQLRDSMVYNLRFIGSRPERGR